MASLLEMILKAQGGALVKNIAQQQGLDAGTAFTAIGALLPAITGGIKQNIQQDNGLGGLLDALNKGGHQKYVDQPESISSQSAVDEGNSILGHILGSKEASRAVASAAAEKTGIDINILKKILPQVEGVAMGGMSQQLNSSSGALSGILGQVMGGGQTSTKTSTKTSGVLSGLLGGLLGKKKAPQTRSPDLGGLLGSLLGGKSAQQLPPEVKEQSRSVLSKMLDMDGDGSNLDELMSMAKKFL